MGSFSTETLNPLFLLSWVKPWPQTPSGTVGSHIAPPSPRTKHCHSDSATLQRCSCRPAMWQYLNTLPSAPVFCTVFPSAQYSVWKKNPITVQQNTADQKPTLNAGSMCFSNEGTFLTTLVLSAMATCMVRTWTNWMECDINLKQRDRPHHTSGLCKMMQKPVSLELILICDMQQEQTTCA